MLKLTGLTLLLVVISLIQCAPVKNSKKLFEEVEYDVTLSKQPGEKRYFIKANEIPVYQHQFEKIRELGQEISCKIRGDCQGEKRGKISFSGTMGQKKSAFDKDIEGLDDRSLQDQLGDLGRNFGGGPGDINPTIGDQKYASRYGQQPQMDIKMTPEESAAIQAGAGSLSGVGPGGPSSQNVGGPMYGNDAMLKMQEDQNNDMIQNSINSKINFMDSANKDRLSQELPSGLSQGMLGGSIPGMPGGDAIQGVQGGPMEGLGGETSQSFHGQGEGKDAMSNAVSDNDIMKAEDIQPSEMQGIDHFLKDSNHMDKPVEPSNDDSSDDSDNGPSDLGKTNVDIGGDQSSIENNVGGMADHGNSNGAGPDLQAAFGGMQDANQEPIRPGGMEVPTLNNLGLGMSAAEMGPMGQSPNLNFIQDNTRQMIEQNSDYKVPQTAFSSLWNSYMSSTQSQLGERDPSANSRGEIERPGKSSKPHRRSNGRSRKDH